MDTFEEIMAFFSVDTKPPTQENNGGSGTGVYCVVAAREDLPDDENNGGSGTGVYCVVA